MTVKTLIASDFYFAFEFISLTLPSSEKEEEGHHKMFATTSRPPPKRMVSPLSTFCLDSLISELFGQESTYSVLFVYVNLLDHVLLHNTL